MRCVAFLCGILVGQLACTPLLAVTYTVAQRHPGANDEGPGTAGQPWKSFGRAAQQAGPGDVVLVGDGVYREHVVLKRSGRPGAPIRFAAAPGAHVVLTGADRLTGWQKPEATSPVQRVAWTHRFATWSRSMAHPDDDYHRLIGRCEQVAVDGYLLRQVLERGQLARGTFFVDVTNQVLEAWDSANRDLNQTEVEAASRDEILRVEGEHVALRGLRFRFAANLAQHGAVVLAGAHGLLEDCILESMNSSGATFAAEHLVVRRCIFRDNGQLGFGAHGAHHLLFTGCLVENNNVKGFDRGWEAGGDKLVLCRDAVLEQSRFVRNRGNGIWFDIGNEHCTVRHCLIADNEDCGIFYEISYGLQALDNVIVGNGFGSTAGAWGAQAGISLSSSPEGVVERNLIVGNREGFNFREQTRTTPRIGNSAEVPVWNHDERISHNLIALNREAQVWGWFDIKDQRHWPADGAGAAAATGPKTAASPDNLAGAYLPKNEAGQPQGLTLEKLRLAFSENVYFAGPGQGLLAWGVTWARHRSYADLGAFQKELGIDHGSRVLDPRFADIPALDFRLSREQLSQLGGSYPSGEVPGVRLGLQE